MFNFVFIFIGAGLFIGGQMTPNLRLCGSPENFITSTITKVVGLGKVDVE